MLGGIGGRRRRGRQRMRWLDGITDSMDVSLSELWRWWWTGRPGELWFMGLQRVGHDRATELNWVWKEPESHLFSKEFWNSMLFNFFFFLLMSLKLLYYNVFLFYGVFTDLSNKSFISIRKCSVCKKESGGRGRYFGNLPIFVAIWTEKCFLCLLQPSLYHTPMQAVLHLNIISFHWRMAGIFVKAAISF